MRVGSKLHKLFVIYNWFKPVMDEKKMSQVNFIEIK